MCKVPAGALRSLCQKPDMKHLTWKFKILFLIAAGLSLVLVPHFALKPSVPRCASRTDPPGVHFSVDGQGYIQPMSAFWPTGSKHVLAVNDLMQDELSSKTRFGFKNWVYGSGALPGGHTVTITAIRPFPNTAPSSTYSIRVIVAFRLPRTLPSARVPAKSTWAIHISRPISRRTLLARGSTQQLTAVPNPGYIFTGRVPGAYHKIQGGSSAT